ncbi:MAG: response regulator [Treponema sp.]|nr:response regulator [Treponema sp.]
MVYRSKKKKTKNLAVILFSIAAIVVLIITANTALLINSFSSLFRENLRERLLALARSATQIASYEELDQLRKPEDMEKPLYSEIRSRLISFAENNNIIYVYYYYLNDNGTAQPIVDNDLTNDAYTLRADPIPIEAALREAAIMQTAVTTELEKYSTGNERLLSAFAPVINAYGRHRIIVGVDISDQELVSIQNRLRRFLVLLLFTMAFTIACGFGSFYIDTKKEKKLTKQLKQQELMSSLVGSFISDRKTEVLIKETLRTTGDFLEVDRMVIGIAEKNYYIKKPAYFWNRIEGEFALPDISILNALIKNTFPTINPGIDIVTLFCNDVEADKKYHCMKTAGVTAFVWAPLYVDGVFWAILSVECCNGPRIWSESDRQLVSTIASVIAGATARKLRENERDAALKTAENASKAKTDFLSNMSHEMRTPMNAVIGMTAIAKNSVEIDKKNYCLNKIEEASNHLLGVINDILDMSKIEANKFELSPIEFNYEKMLQKVVTVSSFRADEKRQELTINIDKNVPPVLIGDDQRLSQVIANLVSNAIKFTPDGGSVNIDTRQIEQTGDSCTLRISVTDSGIGITEEQKKRLFTSFAQADSGTSRKYGGTGLGLAISKRIVEMMNGEIWVTSESGKGATFTFTAVLQIGKEHLQESLLNPGVDWNNIRILVADDDKSVREFFGEITEWFSIICDIASGAVEALELIKMNGTYDMYFLDWKMPDMDGTELAKQIRARTSPGEKSAIVIISSSEMTFFEEKAKQAGVDLFVLKPLFPSSIADCINQSIGRGALLKEKNESKETDDFSGRRILLAEDVEINREIIISLLEPTGVEIESAVNGKEACELFAAHPETFDLIFMDIQMPEMDGLEATLKIRTFETEQGRHSKQLLKHPLGIPIIAMTANVFKEDVEKCLSAGMNGHVGKPINIDEVLELLRKFLSNPEQTENLHQEHT